MGKYSFLPSELVCLNVGCRVCLLISKAQDECICFKKIKNNMSRNNASSFGNPCREKERNVLFREGLSRRSQPFVSVVNIRGERCGERAQGCWCINLSVSHTSCLFKAANGSIALACTNNFPDVSLFGCILLSLPPDPPTHPTPPPLSLSFSRSLLVFSS